MKSLIKNYKFNRKYLPQIEFRAFYIPLAKTVVMIGFITYLFQLFLI